MTLPTVKLAEIIRINPAIAHNSGDSDELVAFVPMAAVSADPPTVTVSEIRPLSSVKNGFSYFQDGDILVAKITPCFENGKIAQVRIEQQHGFGSTEFYVVRPSKNHADARYILHFLRQGYIRLDGERNMTGSAGQRRVPKHFLESLEIPLPPIAQQKRIAAILDKAEELRSLRRQALGALDAIAQSIFLEMFGDPVTNPKGWEVSKLGNISEQVTDGEHQTPKRTLQGIKLLSARNVQDGRIDVKDVDFISLEEYERIKKRCNPVRGDILISCSGTIGRVTMVETDEPFTLVRSVALIKLKNTFVYSKFLECFLRTPALRKKMQQRANASSQANLFQNQIRDLPAFLPPLPLQQEFARRVEAIEQLKTTHRQSLTQLDALFASLQHRAFRGEL